MGLKGINTREGINRENERMGQTPPSFQSAVRQRLREAPVIDYIGADTPENFGESSYDDSIILPSDLDNLQDIRANEQSAISKIASGLAKGVILAGTTFLDGTVGLVLGGGQAIKEGRFSALWDNDFSKAMQSVNEASEEWLPNYYSQKELTDPWYENIFTANFIGDKFIKNLGFTVGAFHSGNVGSKLLKATKLPEIIGAVTNSSKAPAIVTSGVGATLSAINEGRIEALNNSKDWFELHKAQLDDYFANQYEKLLEEYEATKGHFVGSTEAGFEDPAFTKYEKDKAEVDRKYQEALGRLSEDRLKMGNADLLMNVPLLMASNIAQFAKLYANGYKTGRRANNIVNRAEKYETTSSKFGGVWAGVKGSIVEGTEEISQRGVSDISGTYYGADVTNFYKAQFDDTTETMDWLKATAQGINSTINDGSAWEEFFIGSLTGGLGMPRFRGIKSKEGGFQSPITLEGGMLGEIRDYNKERAREQEIVNYMNSRVQSPEFLNYYQGLIRHNKYQNDMNQAVENDDEFDYKNAEHAQLVSDIMMFDNAGKLEDLITLVNSAFDTSDENLQSIVENTSTVIEGGNRIGPFIDSNGNPMYSTPRGKQEMIEKLTQNRDELLNTINGYIEAKNYIDSKVGQQLSDSQLEELTWMRTQLSNWEDRAVSISKDVKQTIGRIIGSIDSFRRFHDAIRTSEGQRHAGLTERYIQSDKNVQSSSKAIESLDVIRNLSDKDLAITLSNNSQFVKGLIEEVKSLSENVIDQAQKDDVINKLNDIIRLGNASKVYETKFTEYINNPEQQVADHEKADIELRQDLKRKSEASLLDKLTSASNVSEFKSVLDNEQDSSLKESVLKILEDNGNEVANNYREIIQYNTEFKKALTSLGENTQTIQDALALWGDQISNSDNLNQIANLNSVFINNPEAFTESSESAEEAINRFYKANYAVLRAMSKVNNDIRFKNRFSEEYRRPVDEPVSDKGIDKDETGDSGTSTVPYVNPNATPVETPSVPVGNVTAEMVADENRDANRRVENQRSLDQSQQGQRKYYRPAVPELHIEASKEGDFRPFDVVVSEREPNVDFSGIYNYLRDNGAFSYVNAAKLKVGDTLGFMIDPDFNDHTIFLVDIRNNQIVGSIDESDASVARYEGLEEVIKKIRDEFEKRDTWSDGDITTEVSTKEGVTTTKFNRHKSDGRVYTGGGLSIDSSKITEDSIEDIEDIEDIQLLELRESNGRYAGTIRAKVKDGGYTVFEVKFSSNPAEGATIKTSNVGKFFATPQTRVSKIMVGRIPYSTEDRSLADIPGVLDGDTKPVFGIIKNGALTTNEKIDDRLIIKPVDMAQKEGRLYLLIPNAAGTYSPAAVRVKHFNNQEFNLDDATVANTPIGIGINEALDRLADASSQDDVSIAMKELAQDIYMQDVMVTWFNAKAGSGIVISKKVRKSDGTYEMTTINGQEQIKEDKYTIYYQGIDRETVLEVGGVGYDYDAAKEAGADLSIFRQPKDATEIKRDILNTILKFNLPLQVSVSRINDSGYNNRVIKSNVLTSNLREAKVIGSWFTTDYFDKQGNLQKSISPSSVKPASGRRTTTPVGGTEGVTRGTTVKIGKYNFIVDLKSMIFTDENGVKHSATTSNANIFDMAWAQENFGDSTESSRMTENKVITPQERVLDRNTGQYVSEAEAKRIKDKIAGKNKAAQAKLAQAKRVISDIYENQKKVDKARTDSNFYYVLEDDGQYHEYSRVHSRLGDNWLGERTETENSRRALEAGTAVDKVIRDFFTSKEATVKPETLSESAFIDLISKLTEIKSKMEQMGETFMADNIVLFQKYADGTRVAGEVDILSVDKDGNFKIYDVKTSRYSFSDRYFTEKSSKQRMSTRDYYTLQLSAYQNLFESQYGVRPTRLAILPFVLSYDKDKVASITGEKGILIEYNPAVNVPLASVVQAPQQQESLPIFDASFETMNPENRVLPENAFEEGGEVGFYEKDGKLYTGYIKKAGEVEVTTGSGQKVRMPIHVTKVRDRGLGRVGELGSTSEYIVVFPNGYALTVVKRSASDSEAFKLIMDALTAKPEKVLFLSSEKTQMHNPRMLEEMEAESKGEQYSPETTQPSKAATTIQKEDAINNHDEEFEDELDLGELRRVDDASRKTWNQEKELAWVKKVFPYLLEQDRVRIVKGLIQVAENGPVAWGRYSDGIIELSDVAAEGTTYHEAFHLVSDLMLTPQEKEELLNEARQVFGNKPIDELEEDMAEGFREYMASQEDRGLGRKILDFFKNLFAKVTNWKYIKPSLTSYYRMINQGRYSSRTLPKSTSQSTRYRVIDDVGQEFERAKAKVKELNNRRFNTEAEARKAFEDSGINKDFLYRITRSGAKNAIGHKIQLLTREQFNNYKEVIKGKRDRKSTENLYFDRLDSDIQMGLLNKGWTQEKFDSISQAERDQAIECLGL